MSHSKAFDSQAGDWEEQHSIAAGYNVTLSVNTYLPLGLQHELTFGCKRLSY